jgi:hypothetical protein
MAKGSDAHGLGLTLEISVMQNRVKHVILAAAVLVGGTMGSLEWPDDSQPPSRFMRGDFTISSAAVAGEAGEPIRRASCALVRYYVARYTAAVAEAWARGKGATDAEILNARRCVGRSGGMTATG